MNQRGISRFSTIFIVAIVLIAGVATYSYFSKKKIIMCGGIAGLSCPRGYSCEGVAHYPDASGICVFSFLKLFK